MKILSLITFTFLTSLTNLYVNDLELLNSLKNEGEITSKEYDIFKRQFDYKEAVGTDKRLDSLSVWNLDIVYIEEIYFHKKDSFLIKEYYFKRNNLDSISRQKRFYRPDRYYENGKLTNKYFFQDKDGKEHLESILRHMKGRKLITNIDPIAKIEVVHAGCGMTWKYMKHANEKAEKEYKKAKMPNYYLVESLIENGDNKISFQRPVKRKFKVIVEGHSF